MHAEANEVSIRSHSWPTANILLNFPLKRGYTFSTQYWFCTKIYCGFCNSRARFCVFPRSSCGRWSCLTPLFGGYFISFSQVVELYMVVEALFLRALSCTFVLLLYILSYILFTQPSWDTISIIIMKLQFLTITTLIFYFV